MDDRAAAVGSDLSASRGFDCVSVGSRHICCCAHTPSVHDSVTFLRGVSRTLRAGLGISAERHTGRPMAKALFLARYLKDAT